MQRLDRQIDSLIENQRTLLATTQVPVSVTRQSSPTHSESILHAMSKDWRVLLVCIVAVLIFVPLLWFYLLPMVKAPAPH